MNHVDILMQRISEINPKDPTNITDEDIVALVAYHRRRRAGKISPNPMPEADGIIDTIREVLIPTKPNQQFTRRV
ncbi:MAG: hypothetical protein ACREHG_02005 [Candidatus Saccharimonadales bacterium]